MMDKGDGKPADDTPLSPQWLSLAPQRSSSLSTQDSLGPVHSALLASDALDSRSDAPSRPSSRSLSTSRSLSSQWGSSNEQRKTSSGNVSLPSELLFPGVESYGWGEGKSGRSSDLGWHAKKKQGDSSSFEAGGSGSGGLYSPLGTGRTSSLGGRPTGSKPRDISRGWGYQSSAEGRQDGRRRSDHHDGHSGRGSFSGSYGTSQEGYENFKPSSSFDKKGHYLSSSGDRKSERWDRWNSSDGSWRGRGNSHQGTQSSGFSVFSSSPRRGSDHDSYGPARRSSFNASSRTGAVGQGVSPTVLLDTNDPATHRYSRAFMHEILNELLGAFTLLPAPEGAKLDDVASCETPQVQQNEEEEEVPEWAKDSSSLPKAGQGAMDFASLGSLELNPDELWKEISVDVDKPEDEGRRSLLRGLMTKPREPVEPPTQAQVQASNGAAPPPAPAQKQQQPDQWMYKDPKGMVQGPFSTSQMLEWYQAKFFPLHLPVAPQSAQAADMAMFQPLSFWLAKWGAQLDPSPVQPAAMGPGPHVGSFGEPAYQSPKQDSMFPPQPPPQQQQQPFVQGMPAQVGQMLGQGMMYGQGGMPGAQMPFQDAMQMPGVGLGVQPVPMEPPKPQQAQPQQHQVYNQFGAAGGPGPQDPPPPMPPMPAMPAMPAGVASLEQIEARMRAEPRISESPPEDLSSAEPPQKFWGDLPESQGPSMTDIMNEETERAREAARAAKPAAAAARRALEPSPEPQPDIISAGKSNWAEQPHQGNAAAKSLAEIQREEEKARAMHKASRRAQGGSVNSWAAKLGGNNAYPEPAMAAAPVQRQDPNPNDGFEAVTARRKKNGKPAAAHKVATVQRVAPAQPQAKSLSTIQAEEMERRRLAQQVARGGAHHSAPQDDDEMFWEMPSEPQQPRHAQRGSGPPLAGAWGAKQQQAVQAASPAGGAAFPSLSSSQGSQPQGRRAQRSGEQQQQQQQASRFNPGNSGAMSEGFTTWCKRQMRDLNGSEDMTLVEFLMSLNSEKEIKEYVEFYLGKTAKTNKFTTEFLFRMEEETKRTLKRDGAEGRFESVDPAKAAPAGKAKKGKKKGKKLDASLLGFNTGIHLYSDSLEVE